MSIDQGEPIFEAILIWATGTISGRRSTLGYDVDGNHIVDVAQPVQPNFY